MSFGMNTPQVLAGLLAAGVLTGGFDRMALRSGAKDMAAQLRFARAHAIASRSDVPSRVQRLSA